MWICKNNFLVNIINVLCYVFIDLLPIATIFYLHWKNFRKEVEKEHHLENIKQENDKRVSRENSNTFQSNTATKNSSIHMKNMETENSYEGFLDKNNRFSHFDPQGSVFDESDEKFSTVLLNMADNQDENDVDVGNNDRRGTGDSNRKSENANHLY